MSRREELSEGGEGSPFLIMPELEEESYLIDLWYQAGMVEQGASGAIPLSWSEIQSWREENELNLSLFEKQIIRRLSEEYVWEYHAASDKARPAPYAAHEEQFDRVALSNKVTNVFKSLMQKQNETKYEVE